MQKRRLWPRVMLLLLAVVIAGSGHAGVARALTSTSEHYQVTETEFGAGMVQDSCSGEYCAQASIGDMATGGSKSATTAATFGSITPNEPLLEVIVDPGQSNLGVLSTEKTSTKTTIVKIRNYLSNGYTLQIVGDAPKYGSHSLAMPSSPTEATPGTEQFAINLAANTTPNVGANPLQVPSSDMSFGEVADDYRVPNMFKFTSGEVVARSNSESGRTDYTISMIVNVSNATPAGHYSGDFSAIVIPAY